MKRIYISEKFVNILMVFLVLLIIFLLVYSNLFVSSYIEKEQLAEKNRAEYENMAYSMSDAVNFTTEQARKFAVTEDMSCIELYWNEVNVEKHIERVIERLDSFELTEQEKHLLNLAKDYTQLLMEPDIRSMKLMSQALECQSVMPERVQNYKLNIVDENLSLEEKKIVAREILFSIHYTADQYTIKNAIKDFQDSMNIRLASELSSARSQTKMATIFQMVLFTISILLLCVLLFVFYACYIRPVSRYINELKAVGGEQITLLEPTGAKEMRILAEKFNDMYKQMDAANHAKSNFVATMSHEIRTPLNTIIGYLYMFKNMELTKKQMKYMDSIELASKNLLNMVNNILDFSKIEEERMEFEEIDFSIEECLEEIEKIFQHQIQTKGLKYKTAISGYIPSTVRGDMSKLRQILINIISNAIKFTKSGGVFIQVSSMQRIDGKVLLDFRIADTGIGIPKDKLHTIFNMYHQAGGHIPREYGGSGLGLAICKKIVEKWPGKISVESVENIGTTFIVKLPFALCSQEDTQHHSVNTEVDFMKNKILLVDDNVTNLEMEEEILGRLGFEVETAASGEEAIRKVEFKTYDSILMDVRMTPMDGIETTKQIKALPNGKKIAIIALTGDVNEKTIERCKAVGMRGFLSKPLNIQKMVIEFERCLDITSQPSPGVSVKEVVADEIALDKDEIRKNLKEFIALLEECNFMAVQFYEQHERLFESVLQKEKAAELRQLMEAYQMEAACAMLKEVGGYAIQNIDD